MIYVVNGYKEGDRASLRSEIWNSIKHRDIVASERRSEATTALEDLLINSSYSVSKLDPRGIDRAQTAVIAANLAAASARNDEIFSRIETLNDFNHFATRMRSQVRSYHGKLRMPSVIQARAVEYSSLYVPPLLSKPGGIDKDETLESAISHLFRMVILGDPGAGKSTLTSKLCHDISCDRISGLEGHVPLLLIVRDYSTALEAKDCTLVDLLTKSCKNLYNITPPQDALDYLLLNGRAAVIIDGVDELGDGTLRHGFVRLVETFSSLYPLARIVVTSRTVGYGESPLDEILFPVLTVLPFDDQRIDRYAKLWFKLIEKTSGASLSGRLYESFIAESREAGDLRSNPLMLSLLCVLYTSEGFIPNNRPEIYERCANVLFENWDRTRGIQPPPGLRAHLRTVVRRLAWKILNDPSSRLALPRQEIEDYLGEEVLAPYFSSPAEAMLSATSFLEFCAGRAWVLTDVSTQGLIPHYGFVHKTFLEYFAASQLVKDQPEPAAVWRRLKPRVQDASWEVVSQLATQILDGSHEYGADLLISLVLDDCDQLSTSFNEPTGEELVALSALLPFAAKCSLYCSLTEATFRRLVAACLRLATSCPLNERWVLWPQTGLISQNSSTYDLPIGTLMQHTRTQDADRLSRSIAAFINEHPTLQTFDDGAALALAMTINYGPSQTNSINEDLRDSLPPEVSEWVNLLTAPTPDDVRRRGVGVLYNTTVFNSSWHIGYGASVMMAVTSMYGDLGVESRNIQINRLADFHDVLVAHASEIRKLRISLDPLFSMVAEKLDLRTIMTLTPDARGALLLMAVPFFNGTRRNNIEYGDESVTSLATARQQPMRVSAAVDVINSLQVPPDSHRELIYWLMH